jgi:uncharacterized integral membrane protein
VSSQPPSAAPTDARKKGIWTPRRIILGIVLLYVVVVVLANRNQVAVNFVFFKTEASLFVVLLLAIAVGFVAGWLFEDLRDRRKQRAKKVS